MELGALKWSWREESNPRPADYKSAALPTELRQPCVKRRLNALYKPAGAHDPLRRADRQAAAPTTALIPPLRDQVDVRSLASMSANRLRLLRLPQPDARG